MFDGAEGRFARHGRHKREPSPEPYYSKDDIVRRSDGFFRVVEWPKQRFKKVWIQSVRPDGSSYGIRIYQSFNDIRLATEEEKRGFFST